MKSDDGIIPSVIRLANKKWQSHETGCTVEHVCDKEASGIVPELSIEEDIFSRLSYVFTTCDAEDAKPC